MTQHSAIELAASGAQLQSLVAGEQFIVVDLAGEPYGIQISDILEVEQVPNIAPVPHTQDWLHGVVNLRGTVLTLIDPASLLDIGVWQRTSVARLIVVDRHDPVALVVDRLRGMRRLADPLAPEVVDEMPGRVAEFVTAIFREGDRFISILDLHRLLSDAERSAFRPDDLSRATVGGRHPGKATLTQERSAT